MNPDVSIIVPVYRVEAYLSRCLESILAQRYPDFELILVDDGSPDNCPEICDEYAKKDPRIRVMHQPHRGLSDARNAGLSVMNGTYVTFIDSDDLIPPDFLEKMLEILIRTNSDISVCSLFSFKEEPVLQVQDDIEKIEVYSGHAACKNIFQLEGPGVTACGKLYRAELWNGLRFPSGMIHEDNAAVPIAFYKSRFIAVIQNPLYFYRSNPDSIMNRRFSAERFDFLRAVTFCQNFFLENEEDDLLTISERYKKTFLASLILQAYRHHLPELIPAEYRMSKRSALKLLGENQTGPNYYYILNLSDPRLVKKMVWRSRFKKLLRKILNIRK